MSFQLTLFAAGVAAAISLTSGQAEVLDLSPTSSINRAATWTDFRDAMPNGFQYDEAETSWRSDVVGGATLPLGSADADFFDDARGGGSEAAGVLDSDRAMPPALVAGERPAWATMLLRFAGLSF
jgi:hypothetical protein